MRALLFNPTIPRFAATKLSGVFSRRSLWGRFSPLQFTEVSDPPLPADEWVRVTTRLGGICGSDLSMLHLQTSMVTSAYTSFPFVPGHENVGIIAQVGPAVQDLAVGERVPRAPGPARRPPGAAPRAGSGAVLSPGGAGGGGPGGGGGPPRRARCSPAPRAASTRRACTVP